MFEKIKQKMKLKNVVIPIGVAILLFFMGYVRFSQTSDTPVRDSMMFAVAFIIFFAIAVFRTSRIVEI